MGKIKKLTAGLIITVVALSACLPLAGCGQSKQLILASTTSTQDSGLFDVLIPTFEKASGYKVKVIAVGSGEAITLGEKGEADVLLVHSRKAEDQFVANGFGINRKDVMHNDFIIVGPGNDPAKIKGLASAADAFKAIGTTHSIFVSRADKSGTNTKELTLWDKAGVKPEGSWYIETGQSMGETLQISQEKQGYTLTDNATWYAQKANFTLIELVKGDEILYNPYGVIAVNPEKHPDLKINYKGAMAFIEYITGPEGQKIIKDFGVDKYGIPLFYPDVIK
jgi:tungstate transport system substrate-binding protein